MNCFEANKIDIIMTLQKLGFSPVKETKNEAWFLSPLRKETKPSFKVHKVKNVYFDFGQGQGGNLVDLLVKLMGSVKEALNYLSQNNISSFSFHQQPLQSEIDEPRISVINIKPIQHFGLIDYLDSRKISIHAARLVCKEVYFQLNGKNYFSIGIENISGGWDLRNKYFKSGSSPKDISLFKNSNTSLIVTEGMFDMMSLLTMDNFLLGKSDLMVLNSCSFSSKLSEYSCGYNTVDLYLDNDETGKRVTSELMQADSKYIDCSVLYESYVDVNEWWGCKK